MANILVIRQPAPVVINPGAGKYKKFPGALSSVAENTGGSADFSCLFDDRSIRLLEDQVNPAEPKALSVAG